MTLGSRAAAWAMALVLLGTTANAQSDSPPDAQPASPADCAATPTSDVDRARCLVEEGKELANRADWKRALAKFREAAALAESPGVRFDIAFAEERLGKLVAALTDFRLAQREAARGGAPVVNANVAAQIAALEPRIALLAFRRSAGAERAVVYVDGAPLPDPEAARVEVDPGAHHVTALLGGVTRFDRVVRVAEGESHTVTIALTPLPRPPRPPVLGYVLGGTGLVTLGVMGVFLGLRQDAVANLANDCNDRHQCPVGSQVDIDRGRVYTGVAEITGVVGTLALTAGAILVAVNPQPHPSNGRPAASTFVHVGAGRLEIGAAF